jgi:formate dehydrogenase alpha subunit
MTNTIGDIKDSDVIFIIGSNTSENHPVISTYIKRAMNNGTKLIVADPRKIKMAAISDIWIRQESGTDVALINGMMNVIIKEGLEDKNFIADRTKGYEEVKKTVEKYTPEYVEGITGIPADQIVKSAKMYGSAKAASIVYCMGITQHTSGTDNVKTLANLAMLCGNMGISGGGVNPLRGQNNVQGACDMGGLPNVFPAYQPVVNEGAVKKFESIWNVEGISNKVGMTATEMVPAAQDGKLKALYVIGENPLLSDPDINHATKCLANLDLLVVQDIFLTETAKTADVVLPSKCFAEKDGTFANTERRVQRVREAVSGPGEAKTDWEIVCELSAKMGFPMEYKNVEEIFEELKKVTPSYGGLSYQRIDEVGIHWPCPTADHPGTPILHTEQFPIGRGVFHAIDHQEPAEVPDEEYPLKLTTGRLLYHYHTGTMTRKSEGLNERSPEGFAEISFEDAKKYGFENGQLVKVSSRRGEIELKVQISDKAVNGTVFIPFHFAEAAANLLTNAELDPISKIPEFKVCAVKIKKAAA